MRNVLLDILKSYSHKAILQARSQLSLTQAQMADRLSMDTRSYVYLEHGETCCSTLTLALFLIYFIFIERKEHRRFEIRQEIKRHEQ